MPQSQFPPITDKTRFPARFAPGITSHSETLTSRTGCPGDRRRLNLAHELGHVVLRPAKKVDEETVAFRFAGGFLAPRLCIQLKIGIHRTRIVDICSSLPPRSLQKRLAVWCAMRKLAQDYDTR